MLRDKLLYYRNAKRYLKLLEKQNDKRMVTKN
jgi:hypothetical protein